MAGLAEKYIIGKSGGYLGSDGLIQKDLEIFVYQGERMWLEAKYITYTYTPISISFKSLVPPLLDEKELIRYMLIMYASNLFKDCPSYGKFLKECEGIEKIDFGRKSSIPKHFSKLLEETRSVSIDGIVDIYRCTPIRVTL